MREKVARAMYARRRSSLKFEDIAPLFRQELFADVDVMLAALREPTEAMLDAAFEIEPGTVAGAYGRDGDIEIEDDGPLLIWSAMLAAASD